MTPTRGTSLSTPSQPQQSPSSVAATPTTGNVAATPQTEYSTMTPLPGQRRKTSLGPLRRAHPASGATWNVEVIRGKMTSRCLWHACRALVLGMVLMILGAGMATIGYYAVPQSASQLEKSSNSTAFIKNISRGYHLNNLSYIGPIVMGFGGFIVVAACVMTFEARDSAAKVVPARFKMSTVAGSGSGMGGSGGVGLSGAGFGGSGRTRNSSARRGATGAPNGPSSVGSQTTTARWDREARDSAAGPFRASPGDKYTDRQALTAALIHFSRALGTPGQSPSQSRRLSNVSRSGSVPNLHGEFSSANCINGVQSPNKHGYTSKCVGPSIGSSARHHHHHGSNYHSHRNSNSGSHTGQHRRGSSRNSSLTQRSTRDHHSDRYLHPAMLKYHRHAVSVDESHPPPCLRPILSNSHHGGVVGSQPTISTMSTVHSSSASPTHETMRHIKRSDTARQHVLARQRNIEKEENSGLHSPKAAHPNCCGSGGGRRRSSTASDASMASRHTAGARRSSTASHGQGAGDGDHMNGSVEGIPVASSDVKRSPRTWRVSAQISTPSVEKEFRSQLSICSEPAIASSSSPKALSCQSSIEPCVPEEDIPEGDNKTVTDEDAISAVGSTVATIKQRPDTLILECPLSHPESMPSKYLTDAKKSTSFKRKRPAHKVVQKNASVAEIYFISASSAAAAAMTAAAEQCQDYDSIEVIDERRNKSFGQMGVIAGSSNNAAASSFGAGNTTHSGITNNTNLERTDTVIYRDLKDSSGSERVAMEPMAESAGEKQGEVDDERRNNSSSGSRVTIMAEIEQRRNSNTDTDNSDVR